MGCLPHPSPRCSLEDLLEIATAGPQAGIETGWHSQSELQEVTDKTQLGKELELRPSGLLLGIKDEELGEIRVSDPIFCTEGLVDSLYVEDRSAGVLVQVQVPEGKGHEALAMELSAGCFLDSHSPAI